jgi:hypothetical protein
MRRKWEKGDFAYFPSHNFLLKLSALCGQRNRQRNHTAFELGPPSRKRQRPEWLWRVTTEMTERTKMKKPHGWCSHAHAADAT